MRPTHHLIDDKSQKHTCPYCTSNLSNKTWESVWEGPKHYKQTSCSSCHKKIAVKVSFNGSGHDFWTFNSNFSKRFDTDPRRKLLEDLIEDTVDPM